MTRSPSGTVKKRRRVRTVGGNDLQRVLRESGLTLEAAGELIGVESETVWRWLYGRSVPSLASATRIEDEFGVDHRSWLETAPMIMTRRRRE